MLLDQLLRPFGYLAIRHPYKWIVDWFYPIVLASFSLFFIFLNDGVEDFLSPGNFLSRTLSFVQSLPGFYIAALAAIATFGRSDIDSILPEPTPKIKVKFRGKRNLVELTRRRFLAMLFAFLTGESIFLILFSIFVLSFNGEIDFCISLLVVFFFFVVLYQMVIATFWGLYYLGYKLHE